MKTRYIATALGGALALAAATPVWTAESAWSEMAMKPLMATSMDAGGVHVVSYFLPAGGACRLTMMMIDNSDAEGAGAYPTRVQLTIEPGRSAYVDDIDGKTSRFTCLYGAEAMNVVRVNRLALAPER